MYLDANSLCEHPMIQLLPVEIRNWANQKNINSNSFSDNISKDFFVEVYLDYHDEFSDYPLEPVKIRVTKEMSEYQLQIIKE